MKRIMMLGLCILFGSQIFASEPTVDANSTLVELEKAFSKIKTVQTDFVQTKKLKLFKNPVKIKGQVILEVPDHLLWRVHEPIQYVFMLKGKNAVEWDQETNKIKKIPFSDNPVFKEVIIQIKSWFSGEFSQLKKSYTLNILTEKPLVLSFKPKENNKAVHVIEEIRIVIREDRRYIDSMTINEVSGDTTITTFQNVSINKDIPAKSWEIKPQ